MWRGTDQQAEGKILIGGLDAELRNTVLDELTAAGFEAEITDKDSLDGREPDNIANKTKTCGCVQLEMETSFRASLFGTNTRPRRKNTTNDKFWKLVRALRKAMSSVD